MKMQKHKIYGGLLLISMIAIVVSVGFALMDANAGFGEIITTAQMASMIGGDYGCPHSECDAQGGDCPGGNTCQGSDDTSNCYNCKSDKGKLCGNPHPTFGWDCAQHTPVDCSNGKGACYDGACFPPPVGSTPPPTTCGTRPDC